MAQGILPEFPANSLEDAKLVSNMFKTRAVEDDPMEIDEPCAPCEQQQEGLTSIYSPWYKSWELRLPIGGQTYLTVGLFRDKPTVSVRQFYRPNPADLYDIRPGNQAMVMTPEQWQALKRNMSNVSAALLDFRFAATSSNTATFSPRWFHLGGVLYAVVGLFGGTRIVGLGEFFLPRPGEDPDSILPGTKGINLNSDQWSKLLNTVGTVDRSLVALDDAKKNYICKDLNDRGLF